MDPTGEDADVVPEQEAPAAGPDLAELTFGARLRVVRQWYGLTQRALGKAGAINPRTISRWELDRAIPDPEELAWLSEALNVSLEFLVRGENPPSEEDRVLTRLAWTVLQISPVDRARVLQLIDGMLSQFPSHAN
jgi:transcriptional regulator with XRE-family HTH domain